MKGLLERGKLNRGVPPEVRMGDLYGLWTKAELCKHTVRDFFGGIWGPKSLQMVTTAMKIKDACSLEEKL